jgi:hypothetical protein
VWRLLRSTQGNLTILPLQTFIIKAGLWEEKFSISQNFMLVSNCCVTTTQFRVTKKIIAGYKFIWGCRGLLAAKCKLVVATNLDIDI